jgi:DNA-binding NarL/FixJ family response regulator
MTASYRACDEWQRKGNTPVTVALCAQDREQSCTAELSAHLDSCEELRLLGPDDRADADIVLVLAREVDELVLNTLSTVARLAANPAQRTVLVSGPLRELQLNRAIGAGVVSVLPARDATPALIAQAVVACGKGKAILPAQATRWLVDEVRLLQRNILTTHGLNAGSLDAGGLTAREVEVLGLLAEGKDNATIARRLNYSERTIKKTIQDVLSRFRFTNRVQAVSYAMRVGAI